MMMSSILIVLMAPLLAGIVVGVLGRNRGANLVKIGVAAEVLALVASLSIFLEIINAGPRSLNSPWSMIIPVTFYIDRLSAVMLIHIAAISVLIHLFSVRYMQQESGYARFHSLLAFTTFSLFGMVTSGNLLMLLAFWQLLSWLLPLLSYNHQHPPTVYGAFRTFIMQRAGDTAFLTAAVLTYSWFGTLDLQQLFDRAATGNTLIAVSPLNIELHSSTVVTLLLFIGAMAKSAQVPLHMWLPDSLYAPTPVHALLHAGIINAGGFLLTRLAPLFDLSPATLHVVFFIGLLTTLLGSSMMLVQADIKKTLGYSTIGQMGFMIMECGVGAYGLAIFHLIAHGLFKGTIFLNCGQVIHAARHEPRVPAKIKAIDTDEFSLLTWATGFVTTLILPLIIVLAAHGVVDIPLRDSQGTAIFLFFGWATSSQAILTLYRLRAVASWKVAASMLSVLFMVVVTYLLAAENFTHFLFPTAGEVAAHFQAGALPGPVFDFLVSLFALMIIFGWYLIYARTHGRRIRAPGWINGFQIRLYLFLLNRLYLDALSVRVGGWVRDGVNGLRSNKAFSLAAAVIALLVAGWTAGGIADLTLLESVLLLIAASLLPLFPLHFVYLTALTRAPGILACVLAFFLPAAGLYVLAHALPQIPTAQFAALSTLALFGALYGSLKALAQVRIPELLGHAGSASLAAVWWHVAGVGTVDGHAVVYTGAVSLLTAGLLLAHDRLRRRYGTITLDRMHGLARPMPRLATILALLVMAFIGLPPFALFSAFTAILLHAAAANFTGLAVFALCWFFAAWYLFRMMQRLLFGRHRSELSYEDLGRTELAGFVILLLLLVLAGTIRPTWLEQKQFEKTQTIALDNRPWRK